MNTRDMFSPPKRKGVSTILGTLIFIGIIFSSVIPMTLVMRQADGFYERELHEVKTNDELKNEEDLMVYAFSKDEDEYITVFVQNLGEEVVEVVGVWYNNNRTSVSENHDNRTIAPSESVNFAPKLVPGSVGASLKVKVTTEKGNIFECDLGTVKWDGTNGWYTPSFAVSVMILNDWGQYEIIVDDSVVAEEVYVGYYLSSGNEQDEITKTFLVPPLDGEYYVSVKKKVGGGWDDLIIARHVSLPSDGSPVATVVVDGM